MGLPNSQFIKCAGTNGTCVSLGFPNDIIYGADGSYTAGYLLPGQSVICNKTFFPNGSQIGDCYIRENPSIHVNNNSNRHLM